MRRSLLGIGLSFVLLAVMSAQNGPQNGQQNGADNTMINSKAPAAMPEADQNTNNQSTSGSTPQLQTRDPRYRINKTDVLSVNFLFTPEYDQNLQVQPDGYVIPRGVSQVKAEGMTIPEFTEALQQAYGKILHDPVITVLPTNVVPAYFIAGGEVHTPGRYTFQGDTTVAQAISLAGGFTPAAKHSQVILYRRLNNEWVEGRRVDLKHMLNSGNLSEDIHLEPGDMIYVPKNTVSKVQPWLIPVSEFAKFGIFGNFQIK
ncbi:MAG TPA: polysaccharide biosynthesis/export family protein [Terriglobales bacterium]|nr:polysaccharide biosynthesis/export family protein [Terriglobales bacterium]